MSIKQKELLNIALSMDTNKLLQYSITNKIPLNTIDERTHNTLVHLILNIDEHIATEQTKLNFIKFLYEHGININKPNINNQTPLHIACYLQLNLIINFLLSNNVDVNFEDNAGYTAFHYLLIGKSITINDNIIDIFTVESTNEKQLNYTNELFDNQKVILELIENDGKNAFNTISETIKKIIDTNIDINLLIQDIDKKDKIENLDKIIYYINDLIEQQINVNDKISNLQIHQKTNISWSPPEIDIGFIQNGKIKVEIKDNLKDYINNINLITDDYLDSILNKIEYSVFNEIYYDFYNAEIKKNSASNSLNKLIYTSTWDINNNEIKKINEVYKYHNAIDFASSIIDFKNRTYTGGPRTIKISNPDGDSFNKIINFDNIKDNILYLLGINPDPLEPINPDPLEPINPDPLEPINPTNLDLFIDGCRSYIESKYPDLKTNYSKKIIILIHTILLNIDEIIKLSNLLVKQQKEIESIIDSNEKIFNKINLKNILINYINNTNLLNNIFKKHENIVHDLLDMDLNDFLLLSNDNTLVGMIDDIEKNENDFIILINDIIIHSEQIINLCYINKELLNKFIKLIKLEHNEIIQDMISLIKISDNALIEIPKNYDGLKLAFFEFNNIEYYENYVIFIILSFNTIVYSNNNINYDRWLNNKFFNKWYPLLKLNESNLGSWLYGIYTDLECSKHDTKLECEIPFNLLMLIASCGHNKHKNNVIKGVINAYKPWLFCLINGSEINKKIKWILILLNDHIDNNFWNNMISPNNIDTNLLNEPLNDIYILFNGFFNNIPFNEECKKLYNKYGFKDENNKKENLITIIIKLYEKMIYKPLKQTLDDTIYFIKNNSSVDEYFIYYNINIFIDKTAGIIQYPDTHFNNKTISIHYNEFNYTSYYSLINYYIDKDKYSNNTKAQEMNYYHLKIALALGLYYEGLLYSIDFNIKTDFIFENNENNLPNILLGINESHIPLDEKYKSDDSLNKLSPGFIPFPLNFINYKQGVQVDDKIYNIETTNYYNLIDKPIMIPTFHFYFMTIISKIIYYQSILETKLKQLKIIINNLLNGKIKDMHKIFIDYYPSIICLNKIIENFRKSYNENFNFINYSKSSLIKNIKEEYNIILYDTNKLGLLLNKINAYIYIYYYLYSPTNIIKLSNFNYYEITDFSPIDKYLYYNMFNDHDELEHIIYQKNITNNSNPIISTTPPATNIGNFNHFSILSNNTNIKEYKKEEQYFIINKEESLPPSLYNYLADFYKFIIINLITTIYQKIPSYIKENFKKIYEKNSEFYLCQIIEKLILENIKYIIKKTTFNKIKDFYEDIPQLSIEINKNDTFIIIEPNLSIPLNINEIDIDIDLNKIIFTNNLSNIDLFKFKIKLEIDRKNIDLLIKYGGNINKKNMDNKTPIDIFIHNYNYIDLYADIIGFISHQDKQIYKNKIKKDNINNIQQIFNINKDIKLNTILENISKHLYLNITDLINIPISFHICSYLTLQYLSEYLIILSSTYTETNIKTLLDKYLFNLKDIHVNYIFKNLKDLKINKININTNLVKSYESKAKELEVLNKKLEILQTNNEVFLINKLINSTKYKELKKYIQNNEQEYTYMINANKDYLQDLTHDNLNIIDRYNNWTKTYTRVQLIETFTALFNKPNDKNDNVNLLSLYLLKDQLSSNLNNLDYIKHISLLVERYFLNPKYEDNNSTLIIINQILIYLTQNIICFNINQIIEKILITYYTEIKLEPEEINKNIKYILNNNLPEINRSLNNILFGQVAIDLVLNSVLIFKNKKHEKTHNNKTIKSILIEYLDLFKISKMNIPKIIYNIFIDKVVNNFDNFIVKLITLWYVNIENIFKLFINNYRCLQTLSFFN